MKTRMPFLLSILLLGLFPGAAHAAPAAIVKVAQPVVLDQPAQWPAITAVQRMTTAGGEAAQWTACFDATHLYLLVRVRDDSPLKNSAGATDPAMVIKGGDAVGFCFESPDKQQERIVAAQVDGQPLVVCYRPVSSRKKPYTFGSPVSTYVMDYVAPLPAARAVFTPIAGGYAVGLALPWKALGLTPREGLEFPFDAQVIFSDPAGTKNIATAWWHSRGNGPACTVDLPSEARLYADLWGTARLFDADPGPQPETASVSDSPVTDPEGLQPVPIIFTLPRACQVSLVIADATGWIVAEPLRAQAMSAGTHTIYWNGRGYRDMPLPPGKYTWRLGYFNGVRSHFYGAVGNSGRPPYPSADKKGSVGGIHGGPAAVAADAGGIYLLHAGEEGEHGLRKVTATGDVRWTRSLGGFGDGRAVTSDGTRAWMIAGFPELALICMDATTGRDLPMGTQPRIPLGDPKKGFGGLAVIGGKAYISVATENQVLVFDLTTGIAEAAIPLPKPGRLCRQDATHMLAISDDTVVRIDLTNRAVTTLIPGLTAPTALTQDATGRLYVAESGAKQQITQFAPDGSSLRSFGKPGGRAATVLKYDPLEFRNIIDLMIDADGQLWFVEAGWTAPRRIGCLTTDGKWVRDYCGPVYCSSGMVVDLDDPSSVYYHLGPSWMKTHIGFSPTHRWQDATWQIEAIYYLSQSGTETPATPDLMLGPASPSFAAGITFVGDNGVKYFWIDGETTYTRGQPAALWRWADDRWRPAGIQAQAGKTGWTDRNGDGLVQDDEYSKTPAPDGGWRWLGRDLTLYGRQGFWKPTRLDERGVPDYDGGVHTPYATRPFPVWLQPLLGNSEVAVSRPGADGAVYYLANLGNGQGRAFWDRASENKLIKVKDGQVQWWVGHHDGSNRGNGDLTFTYNICGIEDGVIVVADVANQYTAYTDDGLTLGWLLTDDNGRPRWSDDSYVSAERFSGQFIKDPKTGKYLLFCGASESLQVREVLGISPKEITRLTGEVTLVSSMPRSTPAKGATLIPYATWECSNGRFNGIDGEDWEWWPRDYDAVTIRDGKRVVGDVRLRRDAGYLHLFADVQQPADFQAGTGNTPAEPAGQADGVELLLGPLVPAHRRAPVAGDTRVFLSARRDAQGRPVGTAWFTRPAGSPVPASPWLRPMTTWGVLEGTPVKEALEAAGTWMPIPGAKVAVARRPDGQGYRLEAEIPLALFPELTTRTPVTFTRWTADNNHWSKRYTEERFDLAGPVRLNVAIFTSDAAGAVRRLPWLPDNAPAMDPGTWGVANGAVKVSWAAQPGATSYRLYRAATANLADARLVETVAQRTQTSDQPGIGTAYYWLTAVDPLGESQFLGPASVTIGEKTTGEPQIRFTGTPEPALLLPQLPELSASTGTTVIRNLTVTAQTLTATVTPAGVTVSTVAMGENQWRLTINVPSTAVPGTRYTVTLTATGEAKRVSFWERFKRFATTRTATEAAKPATAVCLVTVTPVAVAGVMTHTGGTLAIDTAAAAGKPVTTLAWTGQGSVPVTALGTRGYVLFRRNGSADGQPTRTVQAPFTDTFTGGDGFHSGDADGNMQFDLHLPDGTVQPGRDAQGHVRFGSVNSNAGTPGKPETYPGVSYPIQVTDDAEHRLTVFTPAKLDRGAKQRISLRSATGEFPPATVEFDGSQGGAVVQFRFRGSTILTIQQTVGGMGSSDPGANCAALFLD